MGPLTSSPDELDDWDHRQKAPDEPLEPDEWSDEDADRAEDKWLAQRDSYYK